MKEVTPLLAQNIQATKTGRLNMSEHTTQTVRRAMGQDLPNTSNIKSVKRANFTSLASTHGLWWARSLAPDNGSPRRRSFLNVRIRHAWFDFKLFQGSNARPIMDTTNQEEEMLRQQPSHEFVAELLTVTAMRTQCQCNMLQPAASNTGTRLLRGTWRMSNANIVTTFWHPSVQGTTIRSRHAKKLL